MNFVFSLSKIILITSWLISSSASAMTCKSILARSEGVLQNMLAPLHPEVLVSQIKLNDVKKYNPLVSQEILQVYTRDDIAKLHSIGVDPNVLAVRERVLVDDFRYAIFDVDELRDWTMLRKLAKQPSRAQQLIERIANNDDYNPRGFPREVAEWIRWSIFATKESYRKAEASPDHPIFGAATGAIGRASNFFLNQRTEYRRLVRNKDLVTFEFRADLDDTAENGVSFKLFEDEAVTLLRLALNFYLNERTIVDDGGEHKKLSEVIDIDSLVLISRFPELFSAYPVFKGGAFDFDKSTTDILSDDWFVVMKRTFWGGAALSSDYKTVFNVEISEGSEPDRLNSSLEFIIIPDSSTSIDFSSLPDQDAILEQELNKIKQFVSRNRDKFIEITGFNLPEITTELRDYDYDGYTLEFKSEVPEFIKIAFSSMLNQK